jgi:OmpR-family two-component system manganese-sensing response regulator
MIMAKILLVEDDRNLSSVIQACLESDRHNVDAVERGVMAMAALRTQAYDVLILDWNLPDMTGLDICKQFRNSGGAVPVLMLTAKGSVGDKTTALDAGADDYVVKPFEPSELLARVRALLRRPQAVVAHVLKVSDLELDTRTLQAKRADTAVELSAKEGAILELLMRYPNQSFTAEAIIQRLWSSDTMTSPETIRTHIKNLRKKLATGEHDEFIKSIRNLGYRLALE